MLIFITILIKVRLIELKKKLLLCTQRSINSISKKKIIKLSSYSICPKHPTKRTYLYSCLHLHPNRS